MNNTRLSTNDSLIQKIDNVISSAYNKSPLRQVTFKQAKEILSLKSKSANLTNNNPFGTISNSDYELTPVQFADY